MPRWRLIWLYATNRGVARRALGVMIIVGTVLNAINQGGALFGDDRIDWLKLALTYLVPYCVATYGAVSAQMAGAATAQVDRQRRAMLTSAERSTEEDHG